MNGSQDKTTRLIIIILAIICVAVIVIFGLSINGSDPSSPTHMTLPEGSISSTDVTL